MSKLFIAIVFLATLSFYLKVEKQDQSPKHTNIKSLVQPLESLQVTQELNQNSELALRRKLTKIQSELELNHLKNYSDFSESERLQYNKQVRETVKIKKMLFLKKYAHWSDT